jgi:hypothetical protein
LIPILLHQTLVKPDVLENTWVEVGGSRERRHVSRWGLAGAHVVFQGVSIDLIVEIDSVGACLFIHLDRTGPHTPKDVTTAREAPAVLNAAAALRGHLYLMGFLLMVV